MDRDSVLHHQHTLDQIDIASRRKHRPLPSLHHNKEFSQKAASQGPDF